MENRNQRTNGKNSSKNIILSNARWFSFFGAAKAT